MPPTDAYPPTGHPAAPATAADPGSTTTLLDAYGDTAGPVPGSGPAGHSTDGQDALDQHLPDDFVALVEETTWTATAVADDLLDGVGGWGATATPVGTFRLVPVVIERDLSVVSRWMNDPAVAEFWQLAGPQSVTEAHLRAQLDGDGRSLPCVGLLDGRPMSYWEIYRADLDPLARHYPAQPHDTGIHLLIGGVADRGRGLGSALLRAVADLILDKRSNCARVVAEPDLRNAPSVAAFMTAGFRFAAEVHLPDKRAALVIRDRFLRKSL
jgi:RimJ/RimL family protein N-acetyltransferase